jgi:hypothetical protein
MPDFFSKQPPEDPLQEEEEPEQGFLPWIGTVAAVWSINSLALMLCWNYAMPYLLGVSEIGFFQAGALYVIKNIIFYKKAET